VQSNAVLWQAPPARRTASALYRFAERTAALHGGAADDYRALHAWSVREPSAFYHQLWDFLGIVGDKGDEAYRAGEKLTDVRFFPQARVNYAENLLRWRDEVPALIVHGEDGSRRELSRAGLYELVSRIVQALQAEGVGVGDRVAAVVTHDVEALAGYLACAALGAVWSSCSPDFGPTAASDRLCQIAPKVLLAVTSYRFGGKQLDVTPSLRAVADGTPLTRLVVIADEIPAVLAGLPCVTLTQWLAPYAATTIAFCRLPFSAPLAILFSSGTTGKPKGIVHSALGLLLTHLKELQLHCDIRPGERVFYYTTCGWMMWNWQVSALALGATLVSFDGNPFQSSQERLFDVCDSEEFAVFGTSARYIDACARFGLQPGKSHRLDQLRLILSTGSPLLPASFDHVYRDWKADVQLASISGGTDICGCFLGGNPLLPVRRGELQGPMLGMDVAVFDDDGKPLLGATGELVCRNAHPAMPLYFWSDDSGAQYRAAYFARFAGVWAHGDFAEQRPEGGFIIHGRSDTTLKPEGVRIGTAEIYRVVEALEPVEEALAVGHDRNGDQRVILFVRLKADVALDLPLQRQIRDAIRRDASPRHVPARIFAVPALPRTRSGKLSEAAVREVIHGRPVKNLQALANPECLAAFPDLSLQPA